MAKHNDLGKNGENTALSYLQEQGYSIIETNWRYKHLEIDIIAKLKDILCFIEVKTRKNNYFGEPCLALTKAKQKNILNAANQYIQEHNIDNPIRFDLISIIANSKKVEVEHFEDVFTSFLF
ncbi:YraN family protein [Bacteroides sp.]|uniref:YraN family protein n=1 Tax=Bacteroides sp. TaxID=29523 RepID=UPI00258A35E3|nr:YraN family protein [Bacteroides sp.]